MKNFIVISDIEHSSPRISNIVFYLDSRKFKKFWIGADPQGSVHKSDLPEDFEKEIKLLYFRRRINIFSFAKKLMNKKSTKRDENLFNDSKIKNRLILSFLSFLVPDQYLFTIYKYLICYFKNFDKRNDNIIISSSPYPSVHLVCYILKKLNKDLVWIADFRDLWTLNHNYSFSKFRKRIDAIIEKNLMKKADIITTTTKSWSIKQSAFCKKDVRLLYNGFSLRKRNIELNYKLKRGQNKKYILYVGSLYTTFQDYELLFDNIKECISEAFEIHFLGKINKEIDRIVRTYDIQESVKFIGVFNRDQSILIQKEYDFLLFFDSKYDKGILPLKFFEYINSNKPIICIGGQKNSEVKEILKYLKRGIVIENKESVIELFKNISNLSQDFEFDNKKNEKFSYLTQSRNLQIYINEYLASYNR